MLSVKRVWMASTLVVAAFGAGALPASGQAAPAPGITEGPMLGFGYVANAPQIPVGVAAWGLVPGLKGYGLYADFKTTVGTAADYDNFVPGLTPEEVVSQYDGHVPFDREDEYWAVNLAVVRSLTEELLVYVGGGYGERTRYQEYWDESRQLAEFGYYWVEDPVRSGDYFNLLAGVFFRISSRFRIQFGGEMEPAGFTIGMSFNLPGR